jgi:hypothetical protein
MNTTLGDFGQDLRRALRVLRNNVGYSTVAIVTLALGRGTVVRSLNRKTCPARREPQWRICC